MWTSWLSISTLGYWLAPLVFLLIWAWQIKRENSWQLSSFALVIATLMLVLSLSTQAAPNYNPYFMGLLLGVPPVCFLWSQKAAARPYRLASHSLFLLMLLGFAVWDSLLYHRLVFDSKPSYYLIPSIAFTLLLCLPLMRWQNRKFRALAFSVALVLGLALGFFFYTGL